MKISRAEFLKFLGSTAMGFGLARIPIPENAEASQEKPKGRGKVTILWLGHGRFMFVSCKGKVILLDPWLGTNMKCPTKYRTLEGFSRKENSAASFTNTILVVAGVRVQGMCP